MPPGRQSRSILERVAASECGNLVNYCRHLFLCRKTDRREHRPCWINTTNSKPGLISSSTSLRNYRPGLPKCCRRSKSARCRCQDSANDSASVAPKSRSTQTPRQFHRAWSPTLHCFILLQNHMQPTHTLSPAVSVVCCSNRLT